MPTSKQSALDVSSKDEISLSVTLVHNLFISLLYDVWRYEGRSALEPAEDGDLGPCEKKLSGSLERAGSGGGKLRTSPKDLVSQDFTRRGHIEIV